MLNNFLKFLKVFFIVLSIIYPLYSQYYDTNDNNVKHFWATIRAKPPLSLESSIPSNTSQWQQRIQVFNEQIGITFGLSPMPEKTPLNVQDLGVAVSGTVNGIDYEIRKIVYESEPKNYVTCNLYLPKNVTYPVPCLFMTYGHGGGKASMSRQAMVMISQGIAAFVMDHLGYGERTPQGYTHETALPYPIVIGGFKVLETWSVIRGLDYLATRPEIDMTKIGFTGNSGGGTQTQCCAITHIFDNRVKAVAPAGAISSWESMTWPTSGHCQCNVFANLAKVMDHSDTLALMAVDGGASMILTGSQDALQATQTDPLGSGRTAYSNLQLTASHILSVHNLYGNSDTYFPSLNSPHSYDQAKREAMYGFMLKYLKNQGDGSAFTEPSVPVYSDSQLNCYPSGTVPSDAKTPSQLIYSRVLNMISRYNLPVSSADFSLWQSNLRNTIIDRVFGNWPSTAPFNATLKNSGTLSGCTWEKMTIDTEVTTISSPTATYKITVPFYIIKPENVSFPRPVIIALHEDGKDMLFNGTSFIESNIENYVKVRKFIVVCPDPRSVGELLVHWQNSHELAKWSSLFGRPMFGRQIFDIRRVIDYLETRPEIDKEKIAVVGFGGTGKKLGAMLALFVSALDERIKVTIGEGGMATYAEEWGWDWWFFHWYIPIFITPYADIPQVAGLIAPRPLAYVACESASSSKNKLTQVEINSKMSWTSSAYTLSGAGQNKLRLLQADESSGMNQSSWNDLNSWLDMHLTGSAPSLSIDVTELNFGEIKINQRKTLSFNIVNSGGGVLSGKISANIDWIKVSPEEFSGNSQEVSVTVDNGILLQREGSYSGEVIINSNGGDARINIIFLATCIIAQPNPFNPEKEKLIFSGDGFVRGKTKIKIYNITGELIKIISGNEWDGKDRTGKDVSSGLYIFTYENEKEKGTGKFTLIR